MHAAILGAGFCGLAVTWHLLQLKSFKVTLFDAKGIGGGASGMAAGLLHKYVGAHSKLNRHAHEGMAATQELLTVAEKALGYPVADYSGIMRIIKDADQYRNYRECASCNSDVDWIEELPGIFIREGMTVDCISYLQGLWKACQVQGAEFIRASISSLDEIKGFDRIIICLGAASNLLPGLEQIWLSKVKGQLLELDWPEGMAPLKHTLNSYVYITLSKNLTCLAGSTYEREYLSEEPDPLLADQLLRPKIIDLVPELRDSKIIDCRAGIRAGTRNRMPLMQRISDKVFVLTGMGSKGLLYHAYYAKLLTQELL